MVKNMKIPVSIYRHDNPLKDAPLHVKAMRVVYKALRMFYCCVSYYFNPFLFIVLNCQFMFINS